MAPGLGTDASTKTMALLVNDERDDDLLDEYKDEDEDAEDEDDINGILLSFSPTLAGIVEDEPLLFDDHDDDGRDDGSPAQHMMKMMVTANNPGNNKVVKFLDAEEEKLDARRDKERSRQELLSKIATLTGLLSDAEMHLETEKGKRKKKEKNLMKLAKELKKRMSQKEKDSDRIEELEEKRKYLEHHWVLAQKELDQEKALRATLHSEAQKEFEQSLLGERSKHAKTVEEHESRLADLKNAHAQQCDELCREVLKANLEADRLHNELKSKGVHVPRRAMFNDSKATKDARYISLTGTFVAVFFTTLVLLGLNVDMFSKSGLCAPVMPGMILSDSNIEQTFLAPWWAPPSLKEEAFAKFCSQDDNLLTSSGNPPTSLEWTKDGKNNKLVLNVEGKVKLKRTVSKAKITGGNIRLWKRNGHTEDISSLW